MVTGAAVFTLINDLEGRRPFRVDVVSRITGFKLHRAAVQSSEYFSVYYSEDNETEVLKSVELRVPTGLATARDGMVLLDVNPLLCLTQEEVLGRFGRVPRVVAPDSDGPRDLPIYLEYDRQWGALRFGFQLTGTGCLRTVVLDATETP